MARAQDDLELGGMAASAQLAGAFRRAFHDRIVLEPWIKGTGMRPPAYGTLRVIGGREPVSQREVSEIVGLHASDMVNLIDVLEANGWVTRERSQFDRRRYDLRLTKQGRKVLGRLHEIAQAAEEEVLAPLEDAERRTLTELISKVLDGLDAG